MRTYFENPRDPHTHSLTHLLARSTLPGSSREGDAGLPKAPSLVSESCTFLLSHRQTFTYVYCRHLQYDNTRYYIFSSYIFHICVFVICPEISASPDLLDDTIGFRTSSSDLHDVVQPSHVRPHRFTTSGRFGFVVMDLWVPVQSNDRPSFHVLARKHFLCPFPLSQTRLFYPFSDPQIRQSFLDVMCHSSDPVHPWYQILLGVLF